MHLVVYGAVLIAVILFAPDGFMGLIRTLRRRWSGQQGGAP